MTHSSAFYEANARILKDSAVLNQKCVKKVAGLDVWYSNHKAYEMVLAK